MTFSSPAVAAHRATLRRRLLEYCPWFYADQAGPADRMEQAAWQEALRQEMGAAIGPEAYVAEGAIVVGRPGAALRLGRGSYVAAGAYVTGAVLLGDHCSVNSYAVLRDNVTLGNDVRIGAHACLVGQNHGFEETDRPIWRQPVHSKGIVVGNDVWIGSHAVVLDGVTVGSHAIIGGGAVVTKDVPDHAVVVGNPARVVRMRTPAGLEGRDAIHA